MIDESRVGVLRENGPVVAEAGQRRPHSVVIVDYYLLSTIVRADPIAAMPAAVRPGSACLVLMDMRRDWLVTAS